MQREIFDGVPYWFDSKNGDVYYYEPSLEPKSIRLGKCTDGVFVLDSNWESTLHSKLNLFREGCKARSRKPARADP
jgi:hypothetical protein